MDQKSHRKQSVISALLSTEFQIKVLSMANVPKINVVIRKRPLSKKELSNNDMDIVECQGRELIVRELK